MARNTDRAYLLKLLKTETPNNYKFDILNYLHNPAYGYDYPRFRKTLSETEDTVTVREVVYFKHYDGTGEYEAIVIESPKADGWHVVKELSREVLATGNRFNLKTLLSFC